jgi:hypothetical protein
MDAPMRVSQSSLFRLNYRADSMRYQFGKLTESSFFIAAPAAELALLKDLREQ